MYTENVKAPKDWLDKLIACENEVTKWRDLRREYLRAIERNLGKPIGTPAVIIRKNGKRVKVTVASASYTHDGFRDLYRL